MLVTGSNVAASSKMFVVTLSEHPRSQVSKEIYSGAERFRRYRCHQLSGRGSVLLNTQTAVLAKVDHPLHFTFARTYSLPGARMFSYNPLTLLGLKASM